MVARTTSLPAWRATQPRGALERHFVVCLRNIDIDQYSGRNKNNSLLWFARMTDEHAPPIFRANKRRKVLRKRPDSDDQDDDHAAPATVNSDRERGQTPMNGFSMEIEEGDDATSRTDLTRVRKPKKHGIAFSSSDRPTFRTQDDNQETALMVAEPQAIQEANNRFARPTGKAIVQDDRHMYVCHPRRVLIEKCRTDSVGRHT